MMTITVDVETLVEIVSLMSPGNLNSHSIQVAGDAIFEKQKTILNALPASDKKAFIRVSVINTLSLVTGMPPEDMQDENDLVEDLHLNTFLIRALALPFENIARKFNPKAVITPNECEACESVEDCTNLVFSKS